MRKERLTVFRESKRLRSIDRLARKGPSKDVTPSSSVDHSFPPDPVTLSSFALTINNDIFSAYDKQLERDERLLVPPQAVNSIQEVGAWVGDEPESRNDNERPLHDDCIDLVRHFFLSS